MRKRQGENNKKRDIFYGLLLVCAIFFLGSSVLYFKEIRVYKKRKGFVEKQQKESAASNKVLRIPFNSADLKRVERFEQETANGNLDAKRSLALAYMVGTGDVGNPSKAFEMFSELANAGDAIAMFHLGQYYEHGFGGYVDYQKAFDYYMKAFDAGAGGRAALAIGGLYRTGDHGFSPDPKKAAEWAATAEKMYLSEGSAQGFYVLSLAYGNGDNVERDVAKAFAFSRISAEKGHVSSMISLARAYYQGRGVKKNYEAARMWLDEAVLLRDEHVVDIFIRGMPSKRQEIEQWFYGKAK